jgi:hypothetical protein
VEFRNASGADATGMVVDIATSGVAMLGDQGVVAPSVPFTHQSAVLATQIQATMAQPST